ncbi:MAG: hypothetical protein ACRERU_10920 [Methylococcales bacterium]
MTGQIKVAWVSVTHPEKNFTNLNNPYHPVVTFLQQVLKSHHEKSYFHDTPISLPQLIGFCNFDEYFLSPLCYRKNADVKTGRAGLASS